MTARTMLQLPPSALSSLETKVSQLMSQGRYQEGLQELRTMAMLYGIPRDELARQVAHLAIERGHVQPLREGPA